MKRRADKWVVKFYTCADALHIHRVWRDKGSLHGWMLIKKHLSELNYNGGDETIYIAATVELHTSVDRSLFCWPTFKTLVLRLSDGHSLPGG